MKELTDFFTSKSKQLQDLVHDMNRIASKKQKEAKGETDSSKSKSFQPVTRLRKNKEECVKAKENPEMTFVTDKLSDIFGAK